MTWVNLLQLTSEIDMIITDTQKDFKIAPSGSHLGRLYSIIDIGHQSTVWKGETKIMHKVVFTWELHGNDANDQPLTTDDNKPLIVSKRYTVSLGDQSTLRKDLEGWSGKKMTEDERKSFDLKNLLGKFCMVNIAHSDDGKYANIVSLSQVPSAMRAMQPEPINPVVHFWLGDYTQAQYDALPKYYREKIAESSEWRGSKEVKQTSDSFPDEKLPF